MIWNWGPDWHWDKALQKRITEINQSAATILISRQMVKEGFIAYWKEICNTTDDARYELAKHITKSPKLVASTGLTKEVAIPGGWDNVNLINKNLSDEIQDEYYFIVNPVALGEGMSVFKEKTPLTLLDSSYFICGVILSHYEKLIF